MTILYIIGLTGGIASGKSSVVSIIKEYGFPVIEADLLAREVVQKGGKVWEELKEAFPDSFTKKGDLNRSHLASVIFQDASLRSLVNRITHPPILERICERLEDQRKEGAFLVFVDVPLLFEVKMEHLFFEIWVVYVEEDLQIMRLMERDQISEEEARRRISSQIPLSEKVTWAHRVISNSSSKEELYDEVKRVIEDLFFEKRMKGCDNFSHSP